jgi:hypothetical protein
LPLELLPFYRNLGYSETGAEEFQPSLPLKDGVKMRLSRNVKPLNGGGEIIAAECLLGYNQARRAGVAQW